MAKWEIQKLFATDGNEAQCVFHSFEWLRASRNTASVATQGQKERRMCLAYVHADDIARHINIPGD